MPLSTDQPARRWRGLWLALGIAVVAASCGGGWGAKREPDVAA